MEMPLKPATPPTDSSSRTPEPVYYEYNDSFLNKAQGISLADLLDNPATQCWVISAISNASTYAPVVYGSDAAQGFAHDVANPSVA